MSTRGEKRHRYRIKCCWAGSFQGQGDAARGLSSCWTRRVRATRAGRQLSARARKAYVPRARCKTAQHIHTFLLGPNVDPPLLNARSRSLAATILPGSLLVLPDAVRIGQTRPDRKRKKTRTPGRPGRPGRGAEIRIPFPAAAIVADAAVVIAPTPHRHTGSIASRLA